MNYEDPVTIDSVDELTFTAENLGIIFQAIQQKNTAKKDFKSLLKEDYEQDMVAQDQQFIEAIRKSSETPPDLEARA